MTVSQLLCQTDLIRSFFTYTLLTNVRSTVSRTSQVTHFDLLKKECNWMTRDKILAINIAILMLSLKWHFDSLIYPLSVNTSNLITLSFASRAKKVYMYLLPFFNSFDISVYFFHCIVVSTCRCIQKLLMISSHFLTILFIDQDCFSSWTRTLIVHTSVVGDTGGPSNHPALTWILRNWTVGFMIAKKALYLLNCLSELSIVL